MSAMKQVNAEQNSVVDRFMAWGLVVLLVYAPFHGLISTWLTSNFGYDTIWKTAKDVFLAFLALLLLWRLSRRQDLLKSLWKRPVNRFIIGFALLHCVTALIYRPNLSALAAGIIVNLRFFTVFVLAQYIVLSKDQPLSKRYELLLLSPFAVVCAFVILQWLVLPADFLRHFGYGPDTIPVMHTIDQQKDLLRFAGTLRGPNEMGAYLILPLTLVFIYLRKKTKLSYGILAVMGAVALWLSASRSAWLGFAAALGALLWTLNGPKQRKQLLVWISIGCMVGLVGMGVLWRTPFVQQTFLHNDPRANTVDSSTAHWTATRDGAISVLRHPLGRGPGTAGPASFRSRTGPSISENYFLQIGEEIGWPGLALFVVICVLTAQMLYQRISDPLALALFASFIGLLLVSMFLHSWTDEALAVTWWAGAGLVASRTLPTKKQRHED